jgi:GT2 family glycosyltransferase
MNAPNDGRDGLMAAHQALCSGFVDDMWFRRALGAGLGDLGAVAAYLRMPPRDRPALTPYFDAAFYLATAPAGEAAPADALVDFIQRGCAAGRAPHPLIDLGFIAAEDPHVLGTPPDLHRLIELLDYDLAPPGPYFDPTEYRDRLAEAAPDTGMLRHFLTTDLAAGLAPNPYLDPVWYAARHPDVPGEPYAALRHFIVLGDVEARAAGPCFDGKLYRARYPDIAAAGWPPLLHFLVHGRAEGRQSPSETRAVSAPLITMPPGTRLPVDPAAAWRQATSLRARIAERRARQIDDVRPVAPVLRKPVSVEAGIAALAFPVAAAPRVSVLIPMFEELDYTVDCLLALQAGLDGLAVEIIVADDGSTDPRLDLLDDVAGLVLLRAPVNRGFIATCNAAFARCRGDYVLLLNNDTQPQPGAVARLAAELDAHADVAAAGPMLIYPDGRLQEAGCFLRANGETGMVGLFEDPAQGAFTRDRDVAYCSGAALMVRRRLAGDTLFDTVFAPAYCEDGDLCLRLRAAGHRVRYVHAAVVVHHLSVSTNRTAADRKRHMIMRNQQTLLERHGPQLRALDVVRVLAFYLPQFHPTPENDLWWGSGFTEWTNVARAQPSYVGHYQPHLPADLGFYDLRAREALAAQAALAARYGIEGFCVYYYNFSGRQLLGRPLEVVAENPDIAFAWCLCWANENWSRNWDGGTREVLLAQNYDDATLDAVVSDAVAQAADPRYLRVDGRPLFLEYRPLLLPDAASFAARCRAAFAAAGHPGVQLVYVESMEAVDAGVSPASLGFDACVEFPPHGRAVTATTTVDIAKPDWAGYRYGYPDTVIEFTTRPNAGYVRYPAVFPSWDNTPRQPLRGTSFDGATPEAFGVYVGEKLEEVRRFLMGEDRLLFVNAWNEWAEGAHLEPDSGHGHRWLEALRDALAAGLR